MMNPEVRIAPETRQRLQVRIEGTVQGVGFRPFIYRLAAERRLLGWVNNDLQGVTIEVEGPRERLDSFLLGIETEKPELAAIHSLESLYLDPVGYESFEIRKSDANKGSAAAFILPDIATCEDCLREVFDPQDRRYLYPFTNCTNCGPRFSIIRGLPYDRPLTTMGGFVMCDRCREEYEDPRDRRFHAQPNACPACGPQLALWDAQGRILAEHEAALQEAIAAIRQGGIVGMKGLGGFHLVADARSEAVVRLLRERKHREQKPLALMYPDLEQIAQECEVAPLEARLLRSGQAPIVLLKRKQGDPAVAPSVAPGNPYLGIMLPYTPLHHLLLAGLGFPIVATSGNVSDEPICTDEHEALERLAGIADVLLVHNRPIERHMDDSVARIVAGRELVLRRARGYAPLPVRLAEPAPPVIALGAHLKNNVALAVGKSVFVSQHVGDLETEPALRAFRRVAGDLPRLYEAKPEAVACDAHPDYSSSQHARAMGLPVIPVQHHVAHVLSVMAENALQDPVVGFSWDGAGYGLDGTTWGGETLLVDGEIERVAHLRTFMLPGGDKAAHEPRRSALSLLYEVFGEAAFERHDLAVLTAFGGAELRTLRSMMQRGLNCPRTSSAGRLFDGVAALLGLDEVGGFEGKAAMALEFALGDIETDEAYEFRLREGEPVVIDWEPMVLAVLRDLQEGLSPGIISARFHNGLVETLVGVACGLGHAQVALSGG
ncbi:MAG: carbamoyltransferase HypF, partial [Armatimonadia bacterium]